MIGVLMKGEETQKDDGHVETKVESGIDAKSWKRQGKTLLWGLRGIMALPAT